MATKEKIDVEELRKKATEKVEFILMELNKKSLGITEGFAGGTGVANSNLLEAMSEERT
ncbi:hypothetical protein [Serratia sp. 14-2641]|uniref:hypothetical protein n=1 Tax=Serratia sp. 14-2641 TaxID=1841657 RepID=UPI001300E659|nr:hypothetical protein [Serratia sp. 14-2641]